MSDRYFIGQGQLLIGLRNAAGAVPGGFRLLGNCPELTISADVEYTEHRESSTGQRNKDLEIEVGRNVMLNMTMESWIRENLALVTFGTASTTAGATVSGETVRSPSALGTYVPLANMNLTSFTSLGSLTAGTDFTVDLKAGMIYFPPTSSATVDTNYTAAYVFGNTEKVVAFNSTQKEYAFRFNGLNSVEDNSPVIIDVFRCKFRNADELNLIGNEVTPFQVMAAVLRDSTAVDGPFYRIRQVRQ